MVYQHTGMDPPFMRHLKAVQVRKIVANSSHRSTTQIHLLARGHQEHLQEQVLAPRRT